MTEPALAFNKGGGKGRHYAHPVTGEVVPSITNIIKILDKPALPRWAAKVVAETAWRIRNSFDELGKIDTIDVLKGSPWRDSTRAANRGTTIHDYLYARAKNLELPKVDGDARYFQDAADEWIDSYKPKFLECEFTVFGAGYAGTADFICELDGRLVVGDYKTSKDLYAEIALQLAAIANARVIVAPDGSEIPMPETDGAIGVLLTPTGLQVREIDLTGAYEAFLGLIPAWEWHSTGVKMTPVAV